jgi:Glyoxalase/Bleomycin resistance protein/Dioxygenase superfamily
VAVRNPEQFIDAVFELDGKRFEASMKRGQIVHEAFHAALPKEITVGHRLTFRAPTGEEIFADNFLGDLQDHLKTTTIVTTASPIEARAGEWRNISFDHLAITVADRPGARDFFRAVLQMKVMRDDPHLTVMATGPTALFLFDAGQEAPLSTGLPSTWHHIGFVVDDLAAAYAHLREHQDRLLSDFTMLERDERWSLYFFYRNGDVTFMIQFSEIKPAERGFADPVRKDFANLLYDYASRPYGVHWEEAVSAGVEVKDSSSPG